MFKKILSYIITFFLTVILITLLGLIVAKTTILSEQYMLGTLDKNGYYDKMNVHIQESFRNYILQSGLEEDVLENLYETDKLKLDINLAVHALYSNEKLELDITQIKENLQNKINAIMEENKKTPTADEKKSINSFIKSITDTYVSEVTYSISIVDSIGSSVSKVQSLVTIAIVILTILSAVFILISVLLNKNLKFISIAFIALGAAYIILNLSIKHYIDVNNILFLNEVFSNYLIYLTNNILNIIMIVGGVFTILGLALSFCIKEK